MHLWEPYESMCQWQIVLGHFLKYFWKLMVRLFKEYTLSAITNLSYHAANCRVANRLLVYAQKHLCEICCFYRNYRATIVCTLSCSKCSTSECIYTTALWKRQMRAVLLHGRRIKMIVPSCCPQWAMIVGVPLKFLIRVERLLHSRCRDQVSHLLSRIGHRPCLLMA